MRRLRSRRGERRWRASARAGVRIRLGDAVSDAVAGLDQQDGEWFVDHRAQAVDVHAQPVGVGKLLAPDAGLKLLPGHQRGRSEEHTSEIQSLMRTSSAVRIMNKKSITKHEYNNIPNTVIKD